MLGIGRPGRRTAVATLALVVVFVVVGSVLTPQPDPPVARARGLYGSGIAADALANTQIGGTSCGCPNLATSFRFRAPTSTVLTAIRVYLITEREGYSGGSGGAIEVSVEDDAGSDHHPSGRPLATATVPLDTFPRVSFASPPSVVAGALYHLVFRNRDPAPTINFVSVNSLYVDVPEHPRQPAYDDTDWAQLIDDGSGWSIRPQYTPILELDYGDGRSAGVGYVESWIAAAKVVSAGVRVRERFTVSGGNVAFSAMAVRVARLAGDGPLSLGLERSDGRLLARGDVPAADVPLTSVGSESGSGWVSANLPEPVLLVNGLTYDLLLTTDATTQYRVHGLRKGVAVGFSPQTYFADGVAEVDGGGGSWVAFDPGWRGPLSEADLQFLLR